MYNNMGKPSEKPWKNIKKNGKNSILLHLEAQGIYCAIYIYTPI